MGAGLRIVHLSLSDAQGGAARAAYRLHEALRAGGLASRMFVGAKLSTDPTVELFEPPRTFWPRVARVARRIQIVRRLSRYEDTRPPGPFIFHADAAETGRTLPAGLPDADVLHLHWIATFADLPALLRAVGGRTPVVWTLHDMNPFTGGCHYSGACEGYLGSCGRCPQLGSTRGRDLSRRAWRRKRRALAKVPADMLHVVAPSRWLAEAARRSSLLGRFPVHAIPNCLDTERFAPRDRATARRALDLPADARVVLFVAGNPEIPRKGLRELVRALRKLRDVENLLLLSLGEGAPRVGQRPAHRHIGTLKDERVLSLVYSAADVLAIPSREDNLPNTVLEAMACGTPVVGFAAGGIPEMVRPGRTGLLADPGDVEELAEGLRILLTDAAERDRLGAICREVAVAQYAYPVAARNYADLYASLPGAGAR